MHLQLTYDQSIVRTEEVEGEEEEGEGIGRRKKMF